MPVELGRCNHCCWSYPMQYGLANINNQFYCKTCILKIVNFHFDKGNSFEITIGVRQHGQKEISAEVQKIKIVKESIQQPAEDG